MYGCEKFENLKAEVRGMVERIQEREEEYEVSFLTAREVMEGLTAHENGEECTMPKMGRNVEGAAPKGINAYSDGSLKHTKGHFWQVGGAGVWWPGRSKESLSQEEKEVRPVQRLQRTGGHLQPRSHGGKRRRDAMEHIQHEAQLVDEV